MILPARLLRMLPARFLRMLTARLLRMLTAWLLGSFPVRRGLRMALRPAVRSRIAALGRRVIRLQAFRAREPRNLA